jgi:hypothetical protein
MLFGALTPVALRAPSVSTPNRSTLEKQPSVCIKPEKLRKTLDGCRSLFQTERTLRRFAPR